MAVEKVNEKYKTFEEILQNALANGEITAEELTQISNEFEEERKKLDFNKSEKELLKDIANIFTDTKDELEQLEETLNRQKKDKKSGWSVFNLDSDISSSLELMMWSYSYEDDEVMNKYFTEFFKEGKVLSDFFLNQDDFIRCKDNSIEPENLIKIKNLNSSTFDNFKQCYMWIKDKLENPLEEIIFFSSKNIFFDDIISFISAGVDKNFVETQKISDEFLIEIKNKARFNPQLYIKYSTLFLGIHDYSDRRTFKFKEFYDEITCEDVNGLKIVDSLREYIESLLNKKFTLELYKGSGRTIDVSTQDNVGVQFFMGLCQFVESQKKLGDNSEIKDFFTEGNFNNDWKGLISKYEESITYSVDKGANYNPDRVFILLESDTDSVFQNRNEVVSLYENIYGKDKIDDINHKKTPMEIVISIEESLKKGERILFVLGLHGNGIFEQGFGLHAGSAVYSGGRDVGLGPSFHSFDKKYFDLIKNLQSKYKDKLGESLLTLSYNSCNSGFKHRSNDFEGDIFMDSGKHVSLDSLSKIFIEGGSKCRFIKHKPEDKNTEKFLNKIVSKKTTSHGIDYYDSFFTKHGGGLIVQENYINNYGEVRGLYTGEGEHDGYFKIEFSSYDDLIKQIENTKTIYLDNKCIEKLNKESTIKYLEKLKSADTIIPADYNGDGKVSRNELHLYTMEKYKKSALPTYIKDKNGNTIRISDNSDENLYSKYS